MDKFLEKITSPAVIESVVIIALAVFVWLGIKKLLKAYFNRADVKERFQGRLETRIRVSFNLVKYLIYILVVILVLQINGVNVSSLVTGLGIASAIAGLALQDILKDIIMGSHIIADEFFVIGDVVKYGDFEGKVTSFTIRTTKIKSIYTNDVLTVCNRNISEITKVSEQFDINLPLPYEEDAEKISAVLREVCHRAKEIEEIKDCMFLGTESFDDSSIAYKLRTFCNPIIKPTIRRAVLAMAQSALNENGITIPYQQIDIHQKAD